MKRVDVYKDKILSIKVVLDRLQHDRKVLDKEILKRVRKIEKYTDLISQRYIDKLPKDPKDFSKEQWKWILKATVTGNGMVHYRFSRDLLKSLGFDCWGFYPETKQPSLCLYLPVDIELVKKGFEIIQPHFKLVHITEGGCDDFGISINIHYLSGRAEEEDSTLYVCKNGNCTFYTNECEPLKFGSFDGFACWLLENHPEKCSVPKEKHQA